MKMTKKTLRMAIQYSYSMRKNVKIEDATMINDAVHFFCEIASYGYWFIFQIGLILFTSVHLGAILQIKLLPYANSKSYASPKMYDESRVQQMCKEITFFAACMFNKKNGADKNARKPHTCRPNHEK